MVKDIDNDNGIEMEDGLQAQRTVSRLQSKNAGTNVILV
jgi:hypothetical protein